MSGKFAQVGLVNGSWAGATGTDYAQAEEFLEQMGCSSLTHQEFGTLSQGEQQKVLIARARMTRPYLIFLDEPCAGLDPGARENFLSSLRKLAKQKKIPSLVYVTHHIEEILPLFKKTLILKEGRVLMLGKTSDLLKADMVEKLYHVSLNLVRKKGRYWPVIK